MSAPTRQPNFALLLVLVWLLAVLQLVAQHWVETGQTLIDTDDAMRLTQMYDWLGGRLSGARYCERNWALVETFETLYRPWNIEGQSVRPFHRMVAHTGFITVARRVVYVVTGRMPGPLAV